MLPPEAYGLLNRDEAASKRGVRRAGRVLPPGSDAFAERSGACSVSLPHQRGRVVANPFPPVRATFACRRYPTEKAKFWRSRSAPPGDIALALSRA